MALRSDEGEREAIALATDRAGCLLLLDDAQARRHAAMLGVSVTGTLGVLVAAKRKGLLDVVRPLVDRLQELGFWLSPEVREMVLRVAGESE